MVVIGLGKSPQMTIGGHAEKGGRGGAEDNAAGTEAAPTKDQR